MKKKIINKIVLSAIKTNWSLENYYQKQLNYLLDLMFRDIEVYSNSLNNKYIDFDYTLRLGKMYNKIENRLNTWNDLFVKYNTKYIKSFINKVDNNVQSQIVKSVKNLNDKVEINIGGVIKFDKLHSEILAKSQSLIKENILLIKDIPDKAQFQILQKLNTAIQNGDSYGNFAKNIQHIEGITTNRANNIARDQLFKATELLSIERCLELGITHGEWLHTNIPKVPRQSHKKATGRIFDLREGCLIDGEHIQPAQLYGCTCTFKPVVLV